MKLSSQCSNAGSRRARAPGQRGFIMIALLVIVTLMMFYLAATSRTLYQLQRELTVVERTQVRRLLSSPVAATATNALPTGEIVPAK